MFVDSQEWNTVNILVTIGFFILIISIVMCFIGCLSDLKIKNNYGQNNFRLKKSTRKIN